MSYDLLRIPGQTVSFQTKTNPILPSRYPNVQVVGIVSYEIASSIEDVASKYQQVLPYIDNLNVDFSKAEYVIVKQSSGEKEIVALGWVEESTIQSSQRVNKRIDLFDVPSIIDDKLTKSLKMLGITNFKITDV